MTGARSSRAALRSAALALLLAGCTQAPPAPAPAAITESAFVARTGEEVLALAEEDLGYLADRIEARRRGAASRVRDERLESALRDLGCRLAPERCPRLRVVVYEAIYPVLRVWPNDLIEVGTGALVRTTSEDELAGLLAHELAHDGLRHRALAWEAVQRAAIPELMRPGTVIDPPMRLAARSPDAVPTLGANYTLSGAEYAVAAPILMATGLIIRRPDLLLWPVSYTVEGAPVFPIPFDAPHQVTQLAFVSSLEAAAEAEAARRLANAGFDPAAAARFWERAAREPEAAGEIPYLRSFREIHALEGDRRPLATVGAPRRRGGESEAWRAIVRARRPSWLAAEIEAGSWNRALHLVEAWRELDPDASDLLWARGEILRRRDETGDRAAALADLERAVRDPRAPAAAFRSLGLVLDREGRTAEAARAYRGYLERAPSAADAPLLRARLARGHWGTAEPTSAPANGETAPIERFKVPGFGGPPGSTPYGKIFSGSRWGYEPDSREYETSVVFLTVVRQLQDGERLAPEHDPYAPSPGPAHWIRPIFPVALPHAFRSTMNELELVDLFTTLFTAAGAWRAELVSAESVEIGVPGVRAEWRLVEPERGADDRVRAVFGSARGRLFGAIYRADAAGAWAESLADAERVLDSFEIVPDPTPLQRALYQMRPW